VMAQNGSDKPEALLPSDKRAFRLQGKKEGRNRVVVQGKATLQKG